ncbi:hypothetical protein DFQ28_004696 [Apophysomyces sp. BC1034]|nr:hypothetical protein DFQ30_005513 [Apophysomyces sp. BC1015]KAG0178961.1 hypothetical protein DFQ29_002756 [Apophysomyces sp. BC1021]KAG0188569.1 hypothetical protein DFQ28_004696 [Apophysomyces sp. BC1034]
MEDEVPKKAVKALKARLDLVERHLEPLLSRPLTESYGRLPVNEKCQFEVLLCYAINTLFFMYMKTQGQDPQNHEVMKELERVKVYVDRIKRAEGKGPKASLAVDKEAAARFIKAALANDNDDNDDKEIETQKRKAEDSSSDDEETKGSSSNKSRKRQHTDPFRNT